MDFLSASHNNWYTHIIYFIVMCLHRACMCHTIYIYTYMSDKLVSNSHEHCQLCKANGFWAPEQKKREEEHSSMQTNISQQEKNKWIMNNNNNLMRWLKRKCAMKLKQTHARAYTHILRFQLKKNGNKKRKKERNWIELLLWFAARSTAH